MWVYDKSSWWESVWHITYCHCTFCVLQCVRICVCICVTEEASIIRCQTSSLSPKDKVMLTATEGNEQRQSQLVTSKDGNLRITRHTIWLKLNLTSPHSSSDSRFHCQTWLFCKLCSIKPGLFFMMSSSPAFPRGQFCNEMPGEPGLFWWGEAVLSWDASWTLILDIGGFLRSFGIKAPELEIQRWKQKWKWDIYHKIWKSQCLQGLIRYTVP